MLTILGMAGYAQRIAIEDLDFVYVWNWSLFMGDRTGFKNLVSLRIL